MAIVLFLYITTMYHSMWHEARQFAPFAHMNCGEGSSYPSRYLIHLYKRR